VSICSCFHFSQQPQASTSKTPYGGKPASKPSLAPKSPSKMKKTTAVTTLNGVIDLVSSSDDGMNEDGSSDDDDSPRRDPSPEPPAPPRKSNRAPKTVNFYGDPVEHSPEMSRGVPVGPSPTKKRKGGGDTTYNGSPGGNRSTAKEKGKGKMKEKEKEDDEEEVP
jgi:hypothetical protein